jgi:hypothetical protein
MNVYENRILPFWYTRRCVKKNLTAVRRRVVPAGWGRVLEIRIGSGVTFLSTQ